MAMRIPTRFLGRETPIRVLAWTSIEDRERETGNRDFTFDLTWNGMERYLHSTILFITLVRVRILTLFEIMGRNGFHGVGQDDFVTIDS